MSSLQSHTSLLLHGTNTAGLHTDWNERSRLPAAGTAFLTTDQLELNRCLYCTFTSSGYLSIHISMVLRRKSTALDQPASIYINWYILGGGCHLELASYTGIQFSTMKVKNYSLIIKLITFFRNQQKKPFPYQTPDPNDNGFDMIDICIYCASVKCIHKTMFFGCLTVANQLKKVFPYQLYLFFFLSLFIVIKVFITRQYKNKKKHGLGGTVYIEESLHMNITDKFVMNTNIINETYRGKPCKIFSIITTV